MNIRDAVAAALTTIRFNRVDRRGIDFGRAWRFVFGDDSLPSQQVRQILSHLNIEGDKNDGR